MIKCNKCSKVFESLELKIGEKTIENGIEYVSYECPYCYSSDFDYVGK